MTMAYKTGTYLAFHGAGTTDPIASDIKYYNLLKAWDVREDKDFEFVNSHEKAAAVRDSSKKETLRRSLVTRLNRSKNMILILTETTKEDTDWVPFEIRHAIDDCEIPIIAAYPGYKSILAPKRYRALWPSALRTRIDKGTARVIHIPFKEKPLAVAVSQFTHTNLPNGGLIYYTRETYQKWGLLLAS